MGSYVVGFNVSLANLANIIETSEDCGSFLNALNEIGIALGIKNFCVTLSVTDIWSIKACGQPEQHCLFNELTSLIQTFLNFWIESENDVATLVKFTRVLQEHNMKRLSEAILKRYGFKPPPPSDDNTEKKISGAITFYPAHLIGVGSSGTKVFKGKFGERRNVAVKRVSVLTDSEHKIMREVECLLRCDGHENVVKYFGIERLVYSENDHFILIALEQGDMTLADWVEDKGKKIPDVSQIEILRQCTQGVAHLHGNKIIHGDLKPENILIVRISLKEVRVKVADFGISRTISGVRSSLTVSSITGTSSWMPPEVLKVIAGGGQDASPHIKMTNSGDIFSLGCIFYYVLTFGEHPFGKNHIMIPANVLEYKLRENVNIKTFNNLHLGYLRLIFMMISETREGRPKAVDISTHHMFWSKEKSLQFLVSASNALEIRFHWEIATDKLAECVQSIEENSIARHYTCLIDSPNGWLNILCPVVRNYLQRSIYYRIYNGGKVLDLLRCIRNCHAHYSELPDSVKTAFGSLPDEYFNYWAKRFPFLTDMLWTKMEALKGVRALGIGVYYSDICSFDHYVTIVVANGNLYDFDTMIVDLINEMSRNTPIVTPFMSQLRRLYEFN